MLFLEIIIVIFFLGPCVEEFRFGRAQPVLTGQWRWCMETVNDKPARGWEVWEGICLWYCASLLSSRRVVRVSLPAKDEHWEGFPKLFWRRRMLLRDDRQHKPRLFLAAAAAAAAAARARAARAAALAACCCKRAKNVFLLQPAARVFFQIL